MQCIDPFARVLLLFERTLTCILCTRRSTLDVCISEWVRGGDDRRRFSVSDIPHGNLVWSFVNKHQLFILHGTTTTTTTVFVQYSTTFQMLSAWWQCPLYSRLKYRTNPWLNSKYPSESFRQCCSSRRHDRELEALRETEKRLGPGRVTNVKNVLTK